MKKTIITIVVLAVLAVLGVIGFQQYRQYRQDRADRRASECLREYFRIVGDGRSAIPTEKLKPILDEMTALSEECSESMAEPLFTRRLDGAFLIGDFALAEQMMDGVPNKSDNWKKGAKAKIRAHAALSKGDKAAAIEAFEAFCQTLLQGPADAVECDPCTGIEWTREGLLARNKKRIGDLATEIGDKARAEKCLAEARDYAKAALKKAEGDAETEEVLKKEFGALLDK